MFTCQPISAAGFSTSGEDEGISQMPLRRGILISAYAVLTRLNLARPESLQSRLHAFGGILNFLGNMELPELEFSA